MQSFQSQKGLVSFDRKFIMGFKKVTVKIQNLTQSKPGFEGLFLVDTDAIHCMAAASKLVEAGIRKEGSEVYELANDEPVNYDYGFARVSFMGSETVAQVIFGPEDVKPILGVVPLENIGILVDPSTNELKRQTGISLK